MQRAMVKFQLSDPPGYNPGHQQEEPQHSTRHLIYKMSKLYQWMNFWPTIWTRAGRMIPGANHSGCLSCMPINPILGNSTRRSRRQHMKLENHSWLIDLKAIALYILLSHDLGNYRPTRIYIWNNKLHSSVHVGAQLMSLWSQITSISCRVETPHW